MQHHVLEEQDIESAIIHQNSLFYYSSDAKIAIKVGILFIYSCCVAAATISALTGFESLESEDVESEEIDIVVDMAVIASVIFSVGLCVGGCYLAPYLDDCV